MPHSLLKKRQEMQLWVSQDKGAHSSFSLHECQCGVSVRDPCFQREPQQECVHGSYAFILSLKLYVLYWWILLNSTQFQFCLLHISLDKNHFMLKLICSVAQKGFQGEIHFCNYSAEYICAQWENNCLRHQLFRNMGTSLQKNFWQSLSNLNGWTFKLGGAGWAAEPLLNACFRLKPGLDHFFCHSGRRQTLGLPSLPFWALRPFGIILGNKQNS